MKIALLNSLIVLFIFSSCQLEQANADRQTVSITPANIDTVVVAHLDQNDSGTVWLGRIFKCKNEKAYCFYLEKEKNVCTKRFYHFMEDSEEIFGASNLTDTQYAAALKRYKKKWSKIYPLRTQEEAWLFGRGNDDMEDIKEVRINKTDINKYNVYVDFGFAHPKTESQVVLVPTKHNFKIDYCETRFLD